MSSLPSGRVRALTVMLQGIAGVSVIIDLLPQVRQWTLRERRTPWCTVKQSRRKGRQGGKLALGRGSTAGINKGDVTGAS